MIGIHNVAVGREIFGCFPGTKTWEAGRNNKVTVLTMWMEGGVNNNAVQSLILAIHDSRFTETYESEKNVEKQTPT